MRRLIQITFTTAVATAAIAGPAVAQNYQSPDARTGAPPSQPSILNGRDLVSPDARDSARNVTNQPSILNGRDLVSPDARDSARKISTVPQTDLRSPDARDVANNPVATYQPGRVPQPAQPTVLQVPDNEFNWGDAGIGAAGMLALLALIGGTLMITSHRRRDRRFPVATS
jgi:hypothetical protein